MYKIMAIILHNTSTWASVAGAVLVLALPAPWARFLRRPLTAIQTQTKKGKGYNEITINKISVATITIFLLLGIL